MQKLDRIAREALAEYQKIKHKHQKKDIRLVECFEILFSAMGLPNYWEFYDKVETYDILNDINDIIGKITNPKLTRQIDRFCKWGRDYDYLEDCFANDSYIKENNGNY